MKKIYDSPTFTKIDESANDVITTSPGATGPTVEESGGIWDLDI